MGYKHLFNETVGQRLHMNNKGLVRGKYESVSFRSVLESVGLGHIGVEDSHLYERLIDVYKHLSDFPSINPNEAEECNLESERIMNALRLLRDYSDNPSKEDWMELEKIIDFETSGVRNEQAR